MRRSGSTSEGEGSLRFNGPFEVKSSRRVYSNKWITIREDAVIRPGGRAGIFGVVEMVAGASVLPIDTAGRVTLVEEFKYGIERASLETISGAIEESESPEEAARRELREELGLVAHRWDDLGRVDPFTTVVRSPNFMFIARDLETVDSHPDEGEQLRSVFLPLEEAIDLALKGRITHAASCVLLLRAGRLFGV